MFSISRDDPLAKAEKRVAIVYTPENLTPFREHISSGQLRAIRKSLRRAGWASFVAEYDPSTIVRALHDGSPALVLNLAYGYRNRSRRVYQTQADVASVLESTGLMLVGSCARVQYATQDKIRCAQTLRAHGIHSPRCLYPGRPYSLPELAICKPRYGACHRGVRLVDPKRITEQELHNESAMLQEYVDGPEFTIGVLEVEGQPLALPPLEVIFKRGPHIMVSEMSDWDMRPANCFCAPLTRAARRVFRSLQMRDYARIDVRLHAGRICVLDVNSLPNLDPERSYLPLAAKCAGLSFGRLINLLVASALRRTATNARVTG